MSADNGSLSYIKVGGTKIEDITTNGLSSSNDTRQTTTKDSNGVHEYEYSFENNEISFEGFFNADSAYGYEELMDAKMAKTKVTFEYTFGSTAGTSLAYTGTAIITQLDQGAPMEDNMTFTGTLLVDGTMTKGTAS